MAFRHGTPPKATLSAKMTTTAGRCSHARGYALIAGSRQPVAAATAPRRTGAVISSRIILNETIFRYRALLRVLLSKRGVIISMAYIAGFGAVGGG
jgi:hypothetical protein